MSSYSAKLIIFEEEGMEVGKKIFKDTTISFKYMKRLHAQCLMKPCPYKAYVCINCLN